ncbi:hypothetical protein P389DRAFT_196445 [Cystobasidium minutum MCA 4210]|uniref:uncharacterized protein n=1 Tax=Cystobasidium minutum MCA 4210 TaxID=1397322 RepID=UPI0034CE89AA|eukprot:jgi/Rhomi1/196445/gm1.4659_g
MSGIPPEYRAHISEFLNPLLAGVCMNAFLYGVTTCWQWKYWKSYHSDHWILRLCVATVLASDTLGLISVILMLQTYIVPGFGDISALANLGWEWSASGITVGLSAYISQGFLIYRVHRFTKKWWISGPLSLLATVAFAESIWVAIVTTRYTGLDGPENLETALKGWCAVTVSVNALLCGAVVWFLTRLQHLQFVKTRHLVRNLMITALYTGFILVVLEVGCLVTYLTISHTTVPPCFQMTLGRTYSLVLLINLNKRYTDDPSTPSRLSGSRERAGVKSAGEHTMSREYINVQIPELSQIRTRDVVRTLDDDSLPVPLPSKGTKY